MRDFTIFQPTYKGVPDVLTKTTIAVFHSFRAVGTITAKSGREALRIAKQKGYQHPVIAPKEAA